MRAASILGLANPLDWDIFPVGLGKTMDSLLVDTSCKPVWRNRYIVSLFHSEWKCKARALSDCAFFCPDRSLQGREPGTELARTVSCSV